MCLKLREIPIPLPRNNINQYIIMMKRTGTFFAALAMIAGSLWGQTPADSISDGLEQKQDSLMKRLEEVVVEQSAVQHGPVSDIYTITKQMRAGARSAGELLGRINGMTYDYATKALTYGGSPKVKILVDSVAKDEDYIKNLRHQRFDYVSVTPHPAGVYSDYDVVINFHTRKDYEGYEGSAEEDVEIMPGGRNGRGKDFCDNTTEGSFTYTRNKFSFAVRADYVWQRLNSSESSSREFPLNGITEQSLPVDFKNPNKHTSKNNPKVYASADYRINERNIISVQYATQPTANRRSTTDEIRMANSLTGTGSRLFTEESTKVDGMWHNAAINYVGRVSKWQLNGSVTYNTNRYDNYYTDKRSSGFLLEDNRHNVMDYWWIAADANRTTDNGKWQFGINTYTILIDDTQKRLATGAVLSSLKNLRNREGVSVWFIPSRKLNVGLESGINIYRNSYNAESRTDVSPYLQFNASWNISKNLNVRLNYYNCTNPCSLSDLADYGQFSDSLVWRGGNPALKNSTVNSVWVIFQLFNCVYLQGGYTRVGNSNFDIVQSGYGLRPDGIEGPYAMYIPENGRKESYFAHFYGSKNFGKEITLSLETGVEYAKAYYHGISQSAVNPIVTNFTVQYFSKNQTWGAMLRYHYGSSYSVTPQMNSRKADDYIYLVLAKFLMGGKMTLLAMYYPPVHFYSGKTLNNRLTSEALVSRTYGDNLNRVNNKLLFQVQYRFWGGEKVRKIKTQLHEL